MQESQETWVRSLDREDPLEEGMVTHSSVLAWGIPWTQEPGELQTMGSQELHTTEGTEHGTARALEYEFKCRVTGK